MYFLVARSLSPTDPYFVSTTDQPADLVGQRFERGRGDTGDWTPVSESIIFALDVSRVPPQSQTTAPTSAARILRIEPEVRDIRLRPGDEILLAIRVYGRQNIRDDSLADERPVSWDTDGAGRFSGDTHGIVVAFRAPVVSGNYEIKATASGCYPKQSDETEVEAEARCTAVFTMRVLRDRGSVVETPEPRNPAGNIPVVIPGADGTQHAVFTPKEGGSAVGGSCTFEAPPGAVEDLEYIGIAAEETDAEHGS